MKYIIRIMNTLLLIPVTHAKYAMTVATLTFKRLAKLSLFIFKLILFYEYMIDMKNKSIPYTLGQL